jgi:hypothetical protein
MLSLFFFFFLLHSIFSDVIGGIDFGTQYIKTARLTVSGPEMVVHKSGILFPAVVSLKSPHLLTFPLYPEAYNSTRFSPLAPMPSPFCSAIPITAIHSLPRAIGPRALFSTEFNTAKIQNTTTRLSLFLRRYHEQNQF